MPIGSTRQADQRERSMVWSPLGGRLFERSGTIKRIAALSLAMATMVAR